jgi:hypothetical protein
MNLLPNQCPVCQGEIYVTKFRCVACDSSIEGQFALQRSAFSALSSEQLQFLEVFVKCEGKLNRMEGELELSYPTIRSRLTEIVRKLGYEPGKDEPDARRKSLSDQDRRGILDAVDAGTLSLDEALKQLGGSADTKEA